jgi:transposase InsO family protein
MTKKALAKKLGVSRSSLYYKRKQPLKDLKRYFEIKAVMDKNPSYGQERVAIALGISKNTAKRIMKKFSLEPKLKRKKPRYQAEKRKTKHSNLIKNICPIKPNIVWTTDFTWIKYKQKFIYLATILDIFTKRIVGWHILKNHCTDLVKLALYDAVERSKAIPEILHSDQGSEYESIEFENILKSLEIKASRSSVASPWQNGFQESFFSHFKLELGDPNRFKYAGELVEAIHKQINYYNQERIHSKLKMSPDSFFIKYQQTLKDLKTKANC